MKITSIRRSRALSIRTRVLTLALVPSIIFLLAGVVGAGYLIFDAAKTKNYYQLASAAQRDSLPLIVSLQQERRLTLLRLASFGDFQEELAQQRKATDTLMVKGNAALADLSTIAPGQVTRAVAQFSALMRELPAMRVRVDGGQVSIAEAFDLYNDINDQFVEGLKGLAQFAPDAEISYLQLVVAPLLGSAELMQRSDALATANLVGGGLTDTDFSNYQGQVASYHLQLDQTIPLTQPEVQAQYRKLTGSPAWLRLISVEEVLSRGGTQLPVGQEQWRTASAEVGQALTVMLQTQSRYTSDLALSKLNDTLTRSILGAAGVLALVLVVFVFALRLSRRLIERLVRLRGETLELAEKRLPDLVERVRGGADVRIDDEIKLRDYGHDEIGEVADAFNKAQQTAVAAAVQEAKTREGTNKVFLNIAHRSQVIVHRQLKTLDEAERKQEDPEQLELLFQLDHLSTRQRRNAENLIILGGGQPGRRWRNPVGIAEVVRGAAAETEDFARVKAAKMPALSVIGPVVGDLVHLLAELIDNATTFSPPGSRVEIRGSVVGRGVVLEIEDQGLGIEAERVDEFNDMLANPPDFGIMALSTEPRLGLFVVARLAARHGIAVSLRESAYGGTRAIVLVRNDLLGPASDEVMPRNGKKVSPQTEAELTDPGLRPVASVPVTTLKLSIPGAVNLPDLPVVEARPGEDLFRPQRPVGAEHEPSQPLRRPAHRKEPDEEPSARPADAELPDRGGDLREPTPLAPGRPELPQRRRQQNLAPQLREEPQPEWPRSHPSSEHNREDSPEQARSRLAAFQAGTRRGREEPASEETVNGNGWERGE